MSPVKPVTGVINHWGQLGQIRIPRRTAPSTPAIVITCPLGQPLPPLSRVEVGTEGIAGVTMIVAVRIIISTVVGGTQPSTAEPVRR